MHVALILRGVSLHHNQLFISFSRSHDSSTTDCEFTSTRKQKVVGAPRTRILEARLQRAKALITRLRDQYPHLELDKDVSDIFGSPPASPGPQSDICGASDHSPGGGAHDTIDNKPCSAPNQPVGRRYGDPEPNETVIKWSLIAVDQPQLYHQALQSPLSRHPQVVFHGQPAMYSHTMGYSTIPATTESSIRQEETEDPYLEGSSWLHDDGYGPHCQQLLYNITGTF